MAKFEIGKYYDWGEHGCFDPIQVLGRSKKMIRVRNRSHQWRMLLRIDENGNEYVIDSSAPKGYKDTFTVKATDKTDDMSYKGNGSI